MGKKIVKYIKQKNLAAGLKIPKNMAKKAKITKSQTSISIVKI